MMEWSPETIEHAARTLIPKYDPWHNADQFHFDHAAALRAVRFFPACLTFSKGEWVGQPFHLQDRQAAIIGNLFGWKRSDGTRRYRRCLIWTARKSGKTELAAGIATYMLFCDGEPTPEIVSAAGNAEQAGRVFDAAKAMVLAEAELSSRADVLSRAIHCPASGGYYKVINAAVKTKHGFNLSAGFVDEVHCINDPGLIDVLETSMKARRQPLMVYTSTAGEDPESIAGEIYDFGCRVRDKVHDDPEFLPVIYEVPKNADISNPENWKLAQPNLGVTVPIEEYEREYRQALAIPRKMRVFRQLSLNQWVESAKSWIAPDDWRACAGDVNPPDGALCYGGLDCSAVQDTTAILLAFPDGDKLKVMPFIFLPKDTAAGLARRVKRDKAPYALWAEQGHIILTEGNCIDHDAVADKIIEIHEKYDLRELQIDPHNATAIATRLMKAGVRVTTVRQGYSLNEAAKETERLVLSRKLVHPDNPAMNFQMSHTAVKTDAHDNVILDKQRSFSRIDSVVSMVMSVNSAKFGAGLKGETESESYEVLALDW